MIVTEHATDLGPIWTHWSTKGLFRLQLDEPEERTDQAAKRRAEIAEFDDLIREFAATGTQNFDSVKADPTGWTEFTARVYTCCRQIPAGETWTYKQLATAAGNSSASRAVGAAMSRNRILLVIPCHRVVAANGTLRGFSAPGGLETKRQLLDLEQANASASGQLEFALAEPK